MQLLLGVVLLAVALSMFTCGGKSDDPKATAAKAESERAAFLAATGHSRAKVSEIAAFDTCRSMIKRFTRDPEKAEIPMVDWLRDGGADWRFMWSANSRMLRVRNGLGLEVAATGFCGVDEVTGRITLLVIDGEQIIGPKGIYQYTDAVVSAASSAAKP